MGNVVKLDGSRSALFCTSRTEFTGEYGDVRFLEESRIRRWRRQRSMDSIRRCNCGEHSSTQNHHRPITNMLFPGLTISDTPKKNARGKRIAKA